VNDDYASLIGQTFGTEEEYEQNRDINNGKSQSNKQEENGENETQFITSVAKALRLHSGPVKVQGMIVSRSELYKMVASTTSKCSNCDYYDELKHEPPLLRYVKKLTNKCPACDQYNTLTTAHEYVNAVTVELQEIDAFSEIERLPVILFDEDTYYIAVGEKVIIHGEINIIQQYAGNRAKSFPFVYTKSITYQSREDITVTDLDIKAIERFTKVNGSRVIEELVSMVEPSIIGYEHVKEGLLLCAANTGCDDNTGNLKRNRINALLIGDPGLAKSGLLKAAVKLVPNSRYESSQNSSGKSLTAIVTKEDENHVLRLGPVALAKGSICALNELGKMSFEDQGHLLDVMEEGEFTINKYGINATIKAPTTIIASANPINSTWKNNDYGGKIDLNEIPAIKPLVDRKDLIFVFKKPKDESAIREYTYKKSKLEDQLTPDYNNYLRKHIMYAKRINPKVSDEAKIMLNEYYIKISINFGSYRIRETLYRLTKAIARLKLKEIADAEDAKETMQFYNTNLLQYQQVISIPDNPRDITYNECVKILKETKSPIFLDELVITACKRNEQLKRYLGDEIKLRKNWKLRPVLDMLINHTSIKQVQEKPIVLEWIDETLSSSHTTHAPHKKENNIEVDKLICSPAAVTS
jgi:replicative DNA helicase Mcm